MEWDHEKLSRLLTAQLRQLLANASARKATKLVEQCELILSGRPQAAAKRTSEKRKEQIGEVVTEYHFVCRNFEGVERNADGTVWSCSWVVAEDVLKRSIEFGCSFALHESKSASSYLQGKVLGYRRVDDFPDGATPSRLDFHVQPDQSSLPWAGSGAGEKGYKRAKLSGYSVESGGEK